MWYNSDSPAIVEYAVVGVFFFVVGFVFNVAVGVVYHIGQQMDTQGTFSPLDGVSFQSFWVTILGLIVFAGVWLHTHHDWYTIGHTSWPIDKQVKLFVLFLFTYILLAPVAYYLIITVA